MTWGLSSVSLTWLPPPQFLHSFRDYFRQSTSFCFIGKHKRFLSLDFEDANFGLRSEWCWKNLKKLDALCVQNKSQHQEETRTNTFVKEHLWVWGDCEWDRLSRQRRRHSGLNHVANPVTGKVPTAKRHTHSISSIQIRPYSCCCSASVLWNLLIRGSTFPRDAERLKWKTREYFLVQKMTSFETVSVLILVYTELMVIHICRHGCSLLKSPLMCCTSWSVISFVRKTDRLKRQ